MQRISKLTLHNFKFFYDKIEIPFDRKNALIYGENGSGKSSIYWALYTFLQSVFKVDNAEIRKYFEFKHDENLINRYAADGANSAIIVELEDEHGASNKREISNKAINTKSDKLILETTLGSDFIDHKVLSRIYAYYHKEEIDLFDFFHHHLLAFINFREELIKPGETKGNSNSEFWWDYISKGLSPQPKMNDQIYKDFQAIIEKFNKEFDYYLKQIEQTTNEYLKDRFQEKFKINFEYRDSSYNDFKENSKGRSWKIKPPQIIMSVELITDLISDTNKKRIDSPQSFLNEAKLSSLALAMRLAILDEKFVAQYPKILVLDDMLMSMDMSNREFVLQMILENYLKDYQILFFTHQRGLFEDARILIEHYHALQARHAGETNQELLNNEWQKYWKVWEIYESENPMRIPVPKIFEYENCLQKAMYYFKEHIDYRACGNNLRTELENFFKSFLPSKYRIASKEKGMLDGLLKDGRSYFEGIGFETIIIEKLERHLKRSLNKLSHHNPKADFYKKELLDIFHLIDELKKLKNLPVLKTNEMIKFHILTKSGKKYEYTAQLLDSIRLYKNGDAPSYYYDDDKRGYGLISYSEDGIIKPCNGKESNKSLKELYDFTIKSISRFTKEEPIVETNMYTVFTNENDKTLEELKLY